MAWRSVSGWGGAVANCDGWTFDFVDARRHHIRMPADIEVHCTASILGPATEIPSIEQARRISLPHNSLPKPGEPGFHESWETFVLTEGIAVLILTWQDQRELTSFHLLARGHTQTPLRTLVFQPL